MFTRSVYNNMAVNNSFRCLLKEQGINIIAETTSGIIVEFNYEYWFVVDNGGELNIEKVNYPDTLRSIPYTSNLIQMDTMTMVYRVLKALKREEIDYKWCAKLGEPIYDTYI